MEPKRLNKFISDSGFCSRREADRLIEEGRVTVNGKTPEAGTKVSPKDKIRIDDQLLQVRDEAPVYLVFNKPANMSATKDQSVRDNVVRAINYPASLLPIGHLEREAEGVLFLSNDTDFVQKMTRADNKFEKEYLVTVDKIISSDFIARLIEGGPAMEGYLRQKTFVAKEGSSRFRIVLEPGANHQLKKMCEGLGYRVVHLQRLRINDISLAKIPTGHWRTLTPAEIEMLKSNLKGGKASARQQEEYYDYQEPAQPVRSRSSKPGSSPERQGRTAAPTGDRPAKTSERSARPGDTSGSRPGAAPAGKRIGKSAPKGAAGTKGARGASKAAPKAATGKKSSPGNRSAPPKGTGSKGRR